jgi:hypothetical protein
MKRFVFILAMMAFVFAGTANAQQAAPYSIPRNAQFPVICSVGIMVALNKLTPEDKAKNPDKLYAMNAALDRMKQAIVAAGYDPRTAPQGYLYKFAAAAYKKYPDLSQKCFQVYGR